MRPDRTFSNKERTNCGKEPWSVGEALELLLGEIELEPKEEEGHQDVILLKEGQLPEGAFLV